MQNQLFLTEDGSHSVFSETFGATYHSKHGAIQETQHVFIEAGLRYVFNAQIPIHQGCEEGISEINILEIGFGTGLNALMTFIECEKLGVKINYFTFEKHPLSMEAVLTLNYPQLLSVSELPFLTMHETKWGEQVLISRNFHFQKYLQDFERIDFQNRMHLIYFDAFAPELQPELWKIPMMQKMFDALMSKGILTTYCAKGSVKRTMKEVGFSIQNLPGPPHKREMIRAVKF